MEQYSYYDIFLMSPDHGDTSFTVTKEADFGQRTNDINSSLRDVWEQAVQGKVAVSDTKPYAPSANAPAQFVAAPIMDNGEIIGVIALQLSIEAINSIMKERTGMGKPGESYLLGPDQLMRSDSFLDPVHHTVIASFANPDQGKVTTEASSEALQGDSANKIIIDYNGNPVLSSYALLDLQGIKWAILTEIDHAEVVEPIHKLIWRISIAGLILAMMAAIIAYFLAQQITKPLNKAVQLAIDVADGNLTTTLSIHQKDEIGQLATALNRMIQQLRDMLNNINENSNQLTVSSEELSTTAQEMAVNIEHEIVDSVNEAVAGVAEVSSNIHSVNEVARDTAKGAEGINIASQELSNLATQLQNQASRFNTN